MIEKENIERTVRAVLDAMPPEKRREIEAVIDDICRQDTERRQTPGISVADE